MTCVPGSRTRKSTMRVHRLTCPHNGADVAARKRYGVVGEFLTQDVNLSI